MRLKIQTTTAIGLLFAGLLPLIVLLALFTFSTRSELKQAALKERSSLTRRLATEIEGLLQNVVVDLNLISSNPLLVGSATDSSSRDSEFLRLGRDSRFTELALFDSEGYLIAASEEIGVTQDRSPWFERCVERSCTVVSDPIRVGDSNDLAVVVYEAVPADLESDVAVVRARIGFGSVWSILDNIGAGGGSQMFLVDASDNILYSTERSQIFQKAQEVIGDIPFDRLRGNGFNFEQNDVVYIGQLVRPALQLDLSREWALVWMESEDQLYSVLNSIYHQLFLGASVGLLSAVLLGLFIERRLSRPLIAMCKVAGQAAAVAAAGERGLRMSRSGSRELCTLSDTFNEMMDRLEEHQSQLEGIVDERTAELQETISQLRQSQKLEAVGLMAGGIAHDFNNLLTAINGNVNLAIGSIGDRVGGPEMIERLRLAATAGDRAAGVVRKLLAFSRKEELQLRDEDINALVRETVGIVEHTFGPKINIVSQLTDERFGIMADGTQIQQVLMNLCINAKDALNDQGGSITLTTGQHVISESGGSGRAADDYVFIRVVDTGEGIPKDKLPRIFEPFYTTKAPNKGSGLGLAMCYGIITQHGGWIECDSTVGEGTTFTLYLPRHVSDGVAADVPAVNGAKLGHADIRGETILLADDEPQVRAIAEAVLSRHGCKVITADNGQIALDLCAQRPGEISVVILDGAMPVLNGQETFAAMARDYPELPVIICSGNLADDDSFRSPEGRYPDAFILKPYQFDQLIGTVEELVGTFLPS